MGNVAIVCSGGGAKGAFELGALDYLIRTAGVEPDVFTGVSTGALAAAMLAQGHDRPNLLKQLDTLKRVWFSLESEKAIYKRRLFGILGLPFKADSIYHNKPLWKLIKTYVDPKKLKTGRILRIGVANLETGQFIAVDGQDQDILQFVRASASIPVFFNPVSIRGEHYVDGGVIDVTPLKAAFDALATIDDTSLIATKTREPDTIYVILASPLTLSPAKDLNSGISIGLRAVELLVNEVYRTDITLALAINDGLAYTEWVQDAIGRKVTQLFPGYNHANIILIRPKIFHMGPLDFSQDEIVPAFSAGQLLAEQAVADAIETGTNITPEIFDR